MPVPNPNWPLVCHNADFTQGPPNIPGGAQMSLEAPARRNAVRKWATARGRQYELNQVQAGTATLTVTDPLEQLHPLNTSSPFNTSGNTIKPYRALQIGAYWNSTAGNVSGNILNTNNPIPGQPNLGSVYGAYGYDPSFENFNPGFFYIGGSVSFGSVTTLPSGPLNSNVGFETGIPPWVATGGTVAQSTTQKHSGTYSAQLTPNGTAAQVYIESEKVAVTAGNLYCVNVWVWATNAVTTNFSASINWYNASNTYLSTSSLNVSLAAATWTNVQNTFAAPAGAASGTIVPTLSGTPVTGQVFYVDDASLTNATNPADGNLAVTKASIPVVNNWLGWIPRATPGGAYTLSIDVYAPTGCTVQFSYGAVTTSTTVTGAYQTLSLNITATAGTWLQLMVTSASAYPVAIYYAGYKIAGLSPGWSQTAGSAMSYTQVQAHSGLYSLGTVMAASTDNMSLPLRTAPGITYTMSAWIWAVGAGSVVTMSAGGASAPSSTVGAWQRLVVTFTASDAVTSVAWAASAGTFPVSFYVDDVQLEAATSVSAYSASGPTWYPLFTGYIERYPLQYSMSGTRGMRPLTAVDALAVLSRTAINQSYQTTVLADKPTVYIPLSDAAFPQTVQTSQGGSPFIGYTQIGAQSGAVNFGGDTFLDGTRTVSLTQQNYNPPRSSDSTLITYLGTRQGGITMNPQSFTLEMWVRFTSGVAYLGAAAMQPGENTATLAAGPQYWVGLYTSGGRLKYVFWDPNGLSTTTLAPLGTGGTWNGYPDGTWHYVVLILQATNSWNSYQDGVLGTPAALAFTPSQAIRLDNFFIDSTTYFGDAVSNISIANMAVYSTVLTSTQLANHYNRGAGYINEVSGARVTRLLNQYWKGGQTVAAGYLKMAPDYGYQGRMLLDVLQEIQESERGLVYADRLGNVVFEDRVSRYGNQTALWTFGESPSGGEYPYQDYAGDYDPTYTFSQTNLSRPGNSNYPPRVNAQAQTDYGQRILTQTLQANTDFDLQEAGRFYLNRYGTPRVRVQKLTLNPAANPSLWQVVLSLEISQRVTVKRRSGGLTTSNDYYIESIRHNVDADAGTWTVDLEMSPVFVPQAWVLGDPTSGVLGTTTVPVY